MQDQSITSNWAKAGGTLVAVILTLVILPIVVILTAIALSFANRVLTMPGFGIPNVIASILTGTIGIMASRSACDALLKTYSPRAVFIVLVMMAVLGLCYELTCLPFGWARLAPIVQLAAIVVAGHSLFWKSEGPA